MIACLQNNWARYQNGIAIRVYGTHGGPPTSAKTMFLKSLIHQLKSAHFEYVDDY
jgi:hypothetical protein